MFCYTAWTGRDRGVRLRQCVDYMVTSHANALPACQSISVLPSGRLPSTLTRWLLHWWDVGLAQGRQTRSLISWWRAILPKDKRHERPWVLLASAIFPQGQSWWVQRSTPSLKPTATLTASLSRRKPQADIEVLGANRCRVAQKHLAWWKQSLKLLRTSVLLRQYRGLEFRACCGISFLCKF